jgi:hypothetical protein
MAQGFWRLARREGGAYPHGSATSEQGSQTAKEQARLALLFRNGPSGLMIGGIGRGRAKLGAIFPRNDPNYGLAPFTF